MEINHERVDVTSLESLLDFIYTEKICIDQNDVANLLAAFNYLQIDIATKYCFEYLESNVSVETCGEVLKIAHMYQNDSLISKSLKYISSIFKQISCQTNLNFYQNDIFWTFLQC